MRHLSEDQRLLVLMIVKARSSGMVAVGLSLRVTYKGHHKGYYTGFLWELL